MALHLDHGVRRKNREEMGLGLRTKLMVLIGLVVVISYGITFYRTSSFQEDMVVAQAVGQARMLHKQIILTRKWVADHHGLFVMKRKGVEANPFLEEAEISDTSGQHYVKRNPAMVTRELSAYADEAGLCRYRVTSLNPVNPVNLPDPFEIRGFVSFDGGSSQYTEIELQNGQRNLRYSAPLMVTAPCLECHGDQGYKIGDVRGALSMTIPMEWAFAKIYANNRMLLIIACLTILAVGATIYLLIDILVVRRLAKLAKAMDRVPEQGIEAVYQSRANDEIGNLAKKFKDLCQRLSHSQEELDATRHQMFQSKKLAALGRLTAGIAHEINNPLGGMRNCVKSMQDEPDNKELYRRYLPLLGKGLEQIRSTVRRLLDFGRQEPHHIRLVGVDTLIRESFELLGPSHKNVELQLDLSLDRAFPLDAEAMKQIIVNIGLNAYQSMGGEGALSVTSRLEDSAIQLVFSDTGAGIPQKDLVKIFDPFFTTKEVGEGTGLGLSVTYSQVRQLGGAISVQSKEGEGSTFTITIPVDTNI